MVEKIKFNPGLVAIVEREAASSSLSGREFKAIKQKVDLGRELQKRFPQIVLSYIVGGKSRSEIIKEYDLTTVLGASAKVVSDAIGYAFGGYGGELGGEKYEGLIPEEELRKIGKEHREENGRRTAEMYSGLQGRINYEAGRGIFAMTEDERIEACRAGGRVNYDHNLGMFSLSEEEQRKNMKGEDSKVHTGAKI